MKVILSAILLLLWRPCPGQDVLKYVNLFIGTAGDHGQMDPSATVPFGMMKVGPDTYPSNHGGYDFNASIIKGFSHNRFSGTGCSGAGGNLSILPGLGVFSPSGNPVDKKSELAFPGYYSVQFVNRVKTELTADNNTGFHQITFPESDAAYLFFDINSSFAGTYTSKYISLNKNEFFAEVTARNTCGFGRYKQYYHIWSSVPLEKRDTAGGNLLVRFSTKQNQQILLKVTVSSINTSDARQQWMSSAQYRSFETVKENAAKLWKKYLSTVVVEGLEERKELFYTHLYHTFLNPVNTANTKGLFRATDGKVYITKGKYHYDGWSMWDNYRNKFSLISILDGKLSSDIARSLTDLYRYSKNTWSGYYEPHPTVRTDHSIITLLDLYKRGVKGFTIEDIYEKMTDELASATAQSPDSKLELCYDYWALAQFARILKKEDDFVLFNEKAMDYKKVWKDKFMLITGNSDIMHGDGLYEGTLWQYRWSVPFDIPGMIDMAGGRDSFALQLETFFEKNYYNHGNQPDLHAAYLFNYCGKPWLTQKWVSKILKGDMVQNYGTHEKWTTPYIGKIYRNIPEGYIPEMDDDDGTMAAWYVLSSMGIYPVLVGEPVYQLTTPVFDKITINLENGKKFIIKTNRPSGDDDIYIRSAKLNDKKYNKNHIEQGDIVNGGLLELDCISSPEK